MKHNKFQMNIWWGIALLTFLFMGAESCGPAGGDDPGRDYVPDMKHGLAYEANYYDFYRYNTWGSEEEYHDLAQPRKPVEGTIPRGYASYSPDSFGRFEDKFSNYAPNGYVPYDYENTEEGRQNAMGELVENPFPITEKGLEKGQMLYDINCGICHGEKGDGLGYLVREDGGKYPAQPANLISDEFIEASPGRFYHSIMFGYNVMGAYKDKLSYRERWEVIHYIRSLQAKEKELVYSEEENTLNDFALPGAKFSEKRDQDPLPDSNEEVIGQLDQ